MHFSPELTTSRILFLSASGVVACLRSRQGLAVVGRFLADEEGFAQFEQYLAAPPNSPLYLVADLIEEEFRVETVPHVLGRDRRSMIERKLAQFFRATPYHHAEVQSREQSGRRDDRVLFSAITNSEPLRPWLALILAKKSPLAGITSAPLLCPAQAAHHLQRTRPHLLIISHQPHSGLRQTYLRDGRLHFSRLTEYIPAPEPEQFDFLPTTLIEECFQTRHYLERQRFITHQQILEILILAEPGELKRFQQMDADSPLIRVQIHDLELTANSLGLPTGTDLGIASLAQARIRRGTGLPNHYAPASILRYNYIRRFRTVLFAATASLVLASIFSTSLLFTAGRLDQVKQQTLRQESRLVEENVAEHRRNFPAIPVSAEDLKNTVQTLDTLRRLPSPTPMLALVSRALAGSTELQIRRIVWSLAAQEPVPGGTEPPVANLASPASNALLPALTVGKSQITALVDGTIHPFSGQRAAQETLQHLIATLTANPGVTATLLELPLETRPEKGITTKLGSSEAEPNFSVKITSSVTP